MELITTCEFWGANPPPVDGVIITAVAGPFNKCQGNCEISKKQIVYKARHIGGDWITYISGGWQMAPGDPPDAVGSAPYYCFDFIDKNGAMINVDANTPKAVYYGTEPEFWFWIWDPSMCDPNTIFPTSGSYDGESWGSDCCNTRIGLNAGDTRQYVSCSYHWYNSVKGNHPGGYGAMAWGKHVVSIIDKFKMGEMPP